MLPADCAHRLVSLLTQALEDCAEQKQQLQENLTQCQAILGDWNSQAPEYPVLDDGKNDNQGSEPSAKELEELELLNKALEKALRIRAKFQQAPCEVIESAKAAEKKAVSSADVKQQVDHSKESISKTAKVQSVSKKPMPSKKPTAYMLKAPYRTDLDVKRSQVKMSGRLSSRTSKMPGRKKSAKGAASPKAMLPAKVTQMGHEKVFATEEPRTQHEFSKSSHCAKLNPSFGNLVGGGDIAGTVVPFSEAEHNFVGPAPESVATHSHTEEGTPGADTTSQISTLQEKGFLMKLPHPYGKAFSRYTRLGEKCRLCKTSPEAVAARNSFMEKLQATFCLPSLAFSPVEVKEEFKHLRDIHSHVSQCMEAETTESLGENPTWQRQYESLLTLEGLQTIVGQCLDKVHQLREAMESHSKLFPANSTCSEGCSSAWCASPGSQRCWDVETVGPLPLLSYSSLEELKEMEALRLQVAMLRQQLEIQKAMEAELLPLLEPGRIQESSRASLYRAIYTLLCEGGERFPVFVHDEELPS
ncbi:tubulin epsilon and delta complex protein 2 isoform X1 [Zootoca vivipara]|uniref:tubulin epsilon and delta complex protein 2 isoform X1 n=1 Tax=Zootoca vivipara TaxID=8524 RepID=UPI0015905E4D|nr:tubulin epsilon and delta complex protein 2 isoform X1 [Zootoca vivipara]